jgi:2-oxoglutarate ferredoxin oxidoreductase subunit alpha
LRKLVSYDYGEDWALCEGDGPLAVITWGSITGAVVEGLTAARRAGVAGRLIAIRLLAPAQRRRLLQALDGVDQVLVVEQTHSGQFLDYLKALSILPPLVSTLCHPGPLPITPGQVEAALLACHRNRAPTPSFLEY